MSSQQPLDLERMGAALGSLDTRGSQPTADAGRIFDALHGSLPPSEREAVVEALIDDPDAAEAWRLAMELAPAEPVAVASRRTPWPWLAAAAALLLAAGVGWLQIGRTDGEDTPVYRSVDTQRIASLLPAGEPLSREAPVLIWTAIEGARYRVRVLTANLDPIDDATGLVTARYTLPPEVLARVPAGSTVLWQVEAERPGQPPVVSPTFSTLLR